MAIALLSIKPQYADKILAGEKRVEFRKNKFKQDIDIVIVYSSSPEKYILGYFEVDKIVIDTPTKLWKKYNKVGGINHEAFFDYYKSCEQGCSIEIGNVYQFTEKIDPYIEDKFFRAPQSFCYLDNEHYLAKLVL